MATASRQGGERHAHALALEALEPRTVLAVTASLVGTDLQITLGAADDAADILRSGTKYTVSGTGLKAKDFTVTKVASITVTGTAALNQSMTFSGSLDILDAVSVASSVEQTNVNTLLTIVAGDISVGSAAISHAATLIQADKSITGPLFALYVHGTYTAVGPVNVGSFTDCIV